MFTSLRARLWFTYALLITSVLFVVAFVFVIYLIRNPFAARQTVLKLNAVESILLSRQDEWLNLPAERLQAQFARQAQSLQVRILLLAPDYSLLVDTGASSSPELNLRRLLRLNQTLYDVNGQAWLHSYQQLSNGNFLVVAALRPKAALLNFFTDDVLPPLIVGGLIALFLALILAYWMARWVADPLQRVVNAAHEFSGEVSPALPLQGPAEVRQLVSAYNQMTARVQKSQQAQREFVANVSHELKTPLTSIQGFAQALLDGTAATPDEQKQSAQVIYNEAGRMHRMTLNLLDLARLEAGIADLKRAPVDVNALIHGVAERFTHQARAAGVTLIVQAAPTPPVVGDGDRLAQVFTNLVDNALKFTPPGGRITLQTASLDEAVQVQVQDSGAGIHPDALAHIFERFYQADPSRQAGMKHGAGLGLAIVREIVSAHGGKISVRSTPGQGSVFTVWLPLVNPDASTLVRRKA